MRLALILLGAATLAACASSTGSSGRSDYDKLAQDCRDKGGILKSIPGATSSNEAANYSCELRASTLPKGE